MHEERMEKIIRITFGYLLDSMKGEKEREKAAEVFDKEIKDLAITPYEFIDLEKFLKWCLRKELPKFLRRWEKREKMIKSNPSLN